MTNEFVSRLKIETLRRPSALELDLEGGPLNTSVSGFTHASPISELTHHFHMKNFLHIDGFKQYARRLSQVAHLDFSTHREPSPNPGKRSEHFEESPYTVCRGFLFVLPIKAQEQSLTLGFTCSLCLLYIGDLPRVCDLGPMTLVFFSIR